MKLRKCGVAVQMTVVLVLTATTHGQLFGQEPLGNINLQGFATPKPVKEFSRSSLSKGEPYKVAPQVSHVLQQEDRNTEDRERPETILPNYAWYRFPDIRLLSRGQLSGKNPGLAYWTSPDIPEKELSSAFHALSGGISLTRNHPENVQSGLDARGEVIIANKQNQRPPHQDRPSAGLRPPKDFNLPIAVQSDREQDTDISVITGDSPPGYQQGATDEPQTLPDLSKLVLLNEHDVASDHGINAELFLSRGFEDLRPDLGPYDGVRTPYEHVEPVQYDNDDFETSVDFEKPSSNIPKSTDHAPTLEGDSREDTYSSIDGLENANFRDASPLVEADDSFKTLPESREFSSGESNVLPPVFHPISIDPDKTEVSESYSNSGAVPVDNYAAESPPVLHRPQHQALPDHGQRAVTRRPEHEGYNTPKPFKPPVAPVHPRKPLRPLPRPIYSHGVYPSAHPEPRYQPFRYAPVKYASTAYGHSGGKAYPHTTYGQYGRGYLGGISEGYGTYAPGYGVSSYDHPGYRTESYHDYSSGHKPASYSPHQVRGYSGGRPRDVTSVRYHPITQPIYPGSSLRYGARRPEYYGDYRLHGDIGSARPAYGSGGLVHAAGSAAYAYGHGYLGGYVPRRRSDPGSPEST